MAAISSPSPDDHIPLEVPTRTRDAARVKFAICNEIFRDWKLEEVLAYVAGLGYQGIELAPFTLADSVNEVSPLERQKVREQVAQHGLEVVGIHWVLVKPEGLYLNHPDTSLRTRTAAYLKELVDFCADIGGTRMVVGSPRQRNLLPGVSQAQGEAWTLETFRAAIAQAETRGVVICLEPLSPAETNFLNTAEATLAFAKRINSPAFKLILDVKAMCSETKPVPQIIAETSPHFAHFHANDPNLKGPGFGKVDFQPIAAALKAAGYAGFVSVEVFNFDEGPQEIATRSLRYLQQSFA